jgi:hypothetical protein
MLVELAQHEARFAYVLSTFTQAKALAQSSTPLYLKVLSLTKEIRTLSTNQFFSGVYDANATGVFATYPHTEN